MKITDLKVDGFGVWRDLSMGDLSDHVTVIYGENEAGKTTLMHFVRAVLYGFSPERRQRYLPPVHGGRPGGRLNIELPHGRYQIRRSANGSQTGLGAVEVTSADGSFQSCHQLATLLGGIDEPIFNNVFAVGLNELQQLATLNDTQAAQHLYDLTTGLDRVSLFEVMRELAAARERLLGEDEGPSQLTQLTAQRQQLEEELRLLRNRTTEWVQLAAQIRSIRDEITHTEQRVTSLERETRLVEIGCNVRGPWHERAEVDAKLSALSTLAEVPAEELQTLQRLAGELQQHRLRATEIKRQRQGLRRQAAAVDVNDRLWRHAARIEALTEQRSWVGSLNDQISRLEREILELDDELTSEHRQFGMSKGASQRTRLPHLTKANLSALQEPAREARQRKEQLEDARRHEEKSREEARSIRERLDRELSARGVSGVKEAMERAGHQVSQHRRQSQADDRVVRLERQRDQLQDESRRLMERQVLPVRALAGLGVLFIAGMVLLLTALLSPVFALESSTAWVLGFLGLTALMATGLVKFGLQRVAAFQLEECHRQEELAQRQIDKALADQGYVGERNQRGRGASSDALQSAEHELVTLEELLPLEAQLEAILEDADARRRRVAQAEQAYQAARDRWRGALRSLDLPTNLSPKQIKELAGLSRRLGGKIERLNDRRNELEQRQQELAGVGGRVAQLLVEAGLEPKSLELHERMEQLDSELKRQSELVSRRNELKEQYRHLRREQLKHVQAGRKLVRQLRGILHSVGADDQEELDTLVEQLRQVCELRETRDELTTKIAASLGVVCTEEELAPHVDGASQEQLEQRLEALMTQYDAAGDQQKGLYERRGRLTEQLDSLAQDGRLNELQLELACVEKQIEDATRQWRALAVVSLILEEIRTLYESDRQPETLRQASGYLTQLTRGRYTRVWTPLGDNILKVDDGDGHSYPAELLSRGTREQVFLSLRLSLAAAYARRGVILPLVLDDVLVNFDTPRAEAAARVLMEFAKAGHQIFVFTCHEHIMKIFRKLRIEVRQLPAHGLRGNVHEVQTEYEPEEEELEEEVIEEVEEEIVDEDEEEELEEEYEEEEEEDDEDLELADDELEEPEDEFEFSSEVTELPEPAAEEEEEEELLETEEDVAEVEEYEEEEEVEDEPEPVGEDDETEWEEESEEEGYEYIEDDEAAQRIGWAGTAEWEEEQGAGQEDSKGPQDGAEAA